MICVCIAKTKNLYWQFYTLKGAPTVAELKSMKKEAADANVEICSEYIMYSFVVCFFCNGHLTYPSYFNNIQWDITKMYVNMYATHVNLPPPHPDHTLHSYPTIHMRIMPLA